MQKEFQILDEFIRNKGLRYTPQRKQVLAVFLSTEKHVSCEELYVAVKARHPEIGYTTVYRTMKLLSESGLCGEIDFGDGIKRFEHKYGHQHHDHLVCIKCGRFIEVVDEQIERLQEKMIRKHNFKSLRHKLEIFGICSNCKG